MRNFEIKGKTALVTGAYRGIGRAFVERLLELGADNVYAAVRNPDHLEEMTHRYPQRVKPILLDVTNPEHIQSTAMTIKKLDILVNNAGIVMSSSATSENIFDTAQQEMLTNYFGPVHVTQHLLPVLKKSLQGAIINISSIAAVSCFPPIASYSASKAALHSFTQGLRNDLYHDKLQVIGVYPGPTDTRMTEGWEMPKASPQQIAEASLTALCRDENEVFPDAFAKEMYEIFLQHPQALETTFSEMHR
jgi:NAD(P)-dependent dehydrogenase (short-subunit alcohol dehydrogenase family)